MATLFDDDDDWFAAPLTQDLIERVDKAVSLDFTVREISDAERRNPYYQSMKDMFKEHYHAKVLYERTVISVSRVLPKYQYLFGFKHREGTCLIMNKPMHKVIACSPDLEKLNQNCYLVNGLQFILQEVEDDKRWCYVPHCLCEQTEKCELTQGAKKLRIELWTDNRK